MCIASRLPQQHRVTRGGDQRYSVRTHSLYVPAPAAGCARVPQVAPTKLRGTLGTINQLVICLGILAVLCVNVALPVEQWRSFFLLGALPAALLALGARGRAWEHACAGCAPWVAPHSLHVCASACGCGAAGWGGGWGTRESTYRVHMCLCAQARACLCAGCTSAPFIEPRPPAESL